MINHLSERERAQARQECDVQRWIHHLQAWLSTVTDCLILRVFQAALEMRAKYNVTTILLATDSQVM